MGNDNRCHSLFFKFQQQIQQCLRVIFIQRCCRLIQDQEFRMFRQCFRDFYQLLFTYTNILDQSSGGFLQSYYFQIFVCFSIGFIPVDGEGFTSFITQVHVLADGHIGNQRKFLVNDYNSFFFIVFDCIEFTDFTVINDVAFIGSIRINTT